MGHAPEIHLTPFRKSFLHRERGTARSKVFWLGGCYKKIFATTSAQVTGSITRASSRLERRITFLCFHSSYHVKCFHSSHSAIANNNEHKQCFRTINTPAKSQHIHDITCKPMGLQHLDKSICVPYK